MKEKLLCQPPESLPIRFIVEALTKELAERGLTIAIAEGCSGGAFLDNLTIPGATRAFHVGGVFYSPESKIDLGVPEEIITTYGEYSLETAVAMAQAIRRVRNDSLAIASVGDMDPPGGSKPREVFLGFSAVGKKPWGKTVILQPREHRRLLKEQLIRTGFESALFYLLGQKDKDVERVILPSFTPTTLSPELFELTENARDLVETLRNRRLTMATIESCTGGAIANAITDIPGASGVLKTGWVAYDEDIKQWLGVDFETMMYGVYTEKVALGEAQAVLERTDVDLVLATTGVMDTIDTRPYHNDIPPGTIYIATLFRERKPLVCKLKLKTRPREEMKIEAVNVAFDLVRQVLAEPERKLFYPHVSDYTLRFLDRA